VTLQYKYIIEMSKLTIASPTTFIITICDEFIYNLNNLHDHYNTHTSYCQGVLKKIFGILKKHSKSAVERDIIICNSYEWGTAI